MIIKVEGCTAGGSHYFRLTIPQNGRYVRETIPCDYWSREAATCALDLLEKVYHMKRKNIRFVER